MINWFKRKKKKTDIPQEEDLDRTAEQEQPEQHEPEAELEAAPEALTEAPEEVEPLEEMEFPAEMDEEPEEETGEPEAVREKGRFFKKLRERLHKTRERFATRIDRLVLGKKKIDMDLLDELEEVLITSDLGVQTTQVLLDKVAQRIKRQELSDPEKLRDQLREEIAAILSVPAPAWNPAVRASFRGHGDRGERRRQNDHHRQARSPPEG